MESTGWAGCKTQDANSIITSSWEASKALEPASPTPHDPSYISNPDTDWSPIQPLAVISESPVAELSDSHSSSANISAPFPASMNSPPLGKLNSSSEEAKPISSTDCTLTARTFGAGGRSEGDAPA